MKIELTVTAYEHNECQNGWAGEAKTTGEALQKLQFVFDDFKMYSDIDVHFALFDDNLSLAYNGGFKELSALDEEFNKMVSEYGSDKAYAYMFKVYHWLIEDNLVYHDAKSVVGYFVGTGRNVDIFCEKHKDDEHFYTHKLIKRLCEAIKICD